MKNFTSNSTTLQILSVWMHCTIKLVHFRRISNSTMSYIIQCICVDTRSSTEPYSIFNTEIQRLLERVNASWSASGAKLRYPQDSYASFMSAAPMGEVQKSHWSHTVHPHNRKECTVQEKLTQRERLVLLVPSLGSFLVDLLGSFSFSLVDEETKIPASIR